MIFDTDVLISIGRKPGQLIAVLNSAEERAISAQTWMEWIQGARDKAELKAIRAFAKRVKMEIIPIDQAISHRAMYLVEEHGLRDGLQAGDAIIAATALIRDEPLFTLNLKHFKAIRGLDLFRP